MLPRMIAPTSARLIWRASTATVSGATRTKGRNEKRCASTRLTASALLGAAAAAPSGDAGAGARGRTRPTMHCAGGGEQDVSRGQWGRRRGEREER